MIWFEILRNKSGHYVVMKNVENHGIACKGIFRGLKSECENYCQSRNIKLGRENAKEVEQWN